MITGYIRKAVSYTHLISTIESPHSGKVIDTYQIVERKQSSYRSLILPRYNPVSYTHLVGEGISEHPHDWQAERLAPYVHC